MNLKKIISASFIFTALLSSPVFADVDTTANLKGSVNVGGASVEVTHNPTGLTKTTTASSSGNFSVSFLPPGGPYSVKVSAAGYDTELLEDYQESSSIKIIFNIKKKYVELNHNFPILY